MKAKAAHHAGQGKALAALSVEPWLCTDGSLRGSNAGFNAAVVAGKQQKLVAPKQVGKLCGRVQSGLCATSAAKHPVGKTKGRIVNATVFFPTVFRLAVCLLLKIHVHLGCKIDGLVGRLGVDLGLPAWPYSALEPACHQL